MFEDDSDDEESSLDQLEQLEPPSEAEGKVGPLEVMYNLPLGSFGLSTKESYAIMLCGSSALALASASLASVHTSPGRRIKHKNFIFSIHMHLFPLHIKYLVILTF